MPAWIYLATGAGQNIPEQIVLLAIGKEPDIYHQYKIGKMFIRYSWDLLIDQNEMADFTIKKRTLEKKNEKIRKAINKTYKSIDAK